MVGAASRSLRLRLDVGERAAGDDLASRAESEAALEALVDLDQDAKRLGAVVPAEAGARDDPGMLVQPEVDQFLARLAVPGEAAFERAGAIGERHLVGRLDGRTRNLEVRLAGLLLGLLGLGRRADGLRGRHGGAGGRLPGGGGRGAA